MIDVAKAEPRFRIPLDAVGRGDRVRDLVTGKHGRKGMGMAKHYFAEGVNYTEPVFVIVIMALAATRPIHRGKIYVSVSVPATVTVYLTQEHDGWMLSVDPPSIPLGTYPERGQAVLAARAATVARRGWLLVQMKDGPLQYLPFVEMATATIAGERRPTMRSRGTRHDEPRPDTRSKCQSVPRPLSVRDVPLSSDLGALTA